MARPDAGSTSLGDVLCSILKNKSTRYEQCYLDFALKNRKGIFGQLNLLPVPLVTLWGSFDNTSSGVVGSQDHGLELFGVLSYSNPTYVSGL